MPRTSLALLTTVLLTGCVNPVACVFGHPYTFSLDTDSRPSPFTALVREGEPIALRATRNVHIGYGCDSLATGPQQPARVTLQRA